MGLCHFLETVAILAMLSPKKIGTFGNFNPDKLIYSSFKKCQLNILLNLRMCYYYFLEPPKTYFQTVTWTFYAKALLNRFWLQELAICKVYSESSITTEEFTDFVTLKLAKSHILK